MTLLFRHRLRAADAIQLAAAITLGNASREPVEFVAYDAPLNRAAAAEGLQATVKT